MLQALRARPEVVSAGIVTGKLLVDIHDGMDTSPLASVVVAAGAAVEEVTRPRASLEDVFLTLMEESRG